MWVGQSRILFFSLLHVVGDDPSNYIKSIPLVLERNNAISAPTLADILVHLFRIGQAWHNIGIYYSVFFCLLDLHCHHRASNHPVIPKLMCHFDLQCPHSCKQFDPWYVKCLLCLSESLGLVTSLTNFKLFLEDGFLASTCYSKLFFWFN